MKRLVSTSVSDGHTTQTTSYVYDARNRIVQTTDPMGRVTTNTYDPVHVRSQPAAVTDPAGRTTYFSYDPLDRMISKTDPLGATTKFTYDQKGNLTSVTDANGNVTTYLYDLNGRKVSERRPSVYGNGSTNTATHAVINYFYDAADHLLREEHVSALSNFLVSNGTASFQLGIKL